MDNCRFYGRRPYGIAVIHGGPGAPGSVAAIARELSNDYGVLEPIQTAATLEGQILEMKDTIEKHSDLPMILIGHSWGAWLAYIFAARYPLLVRKLVLVGSGPFEHKYVEMLDRIRYSRMGSEEKAEVNSIVEYLYAEDTERKDEKLERLGSIIDKVDSYEMVEIETDKTDMIKVQGSVFQNVWNEAVELRKEGKLLEMGKQIECPVAAIHGDYDPHPAEGVREPLTRVIKDFKFYLLEKCGHSPWKEYYARDEFFRLIRSESEY